MYLLSSQNPKYAVSIESKLLERKAIIKPTLVSHHVACTHNFEFQENEMKNRSPEG